MVVYAEPRLLNIRGSFHSGIFFQPFDANKLLESLPELLILLS